MRNIYSKHKLYKSKHLWCGIPGVHHIYNGDWNDPQVSYKGHICNEWDLQESMAMYMRDLNAEGEDWGDPENHNDFVKFCQAHADSVKQDIMELSGDDYDLNEGQEYIRRGYGKQERMLRNKQMRAIKIYVLPYDVLDFHGSYRDEDLTDDKFRELTLQYGKIYSVPDFEYLWNQANMEFNSDNSYIRIIK